jgi:hypothetical protein
VLAQYYLQLNEFLPVGRKKVKTFVPGCNFFCDRELFSKAGRFPDLRASEDVILGINISRFTKLWFFPDITVSHIFREDWKKYFVYQKLLGRYIAIYRKKESGRFFQKGIYPIFFAPIFFIIKCSRILPRIFRAGLIHILQFTKSLPVFLLGLTFWTVGFVQGSLDSKSQDM